MVNILISYIHLLTPSAVPLNISVLSCLENILQSSIADNVHGADGDDEGGDGVMITVGVVMMAVLLGWSGSNSLTYNVPVAALRLCVVNSFKHLSFLRWILSPPLFKKLIYFNWRLVTLQYCGGFCHTFTPPFLR